MRGRVQGVGFRPTVWRLAREHGLGGEVLNDAQGVLIRAGGDAARIEAFLAALKAGPPPLARIDAIEARAFSGPLPVDFRIAASVEGAAHTQISPDAAICPACAKETLTPGGRRYRYGFTNCTHCGPRLSIVQGLPYDRGKTTMAPFALCEACLTEYRDPADRRFHAQPTACPACGPTARLISLADDGLDVEAAEGADAIEAAANRLRAGAIVAVKGLGGYQLACDATNAAAVEGLRRAKKRDAKPFALMARDLAVIRRYCAPSAGEVRELASPRAPIVLMRADGPRSLPAAVAPGLTTLGFMLPTTPLHLILLSGLDFPLVMTSGNVSDEPQVTDDGEARQRLGAIAGHALVHDRQIANRLDDSVVRFMAGKPRLLRRARGYAPAPIALPQGLRGAPDILAMGGELKSTFCLVKDGEAIVSQHQGDLEHPAAFDDYRKNLALYRELFDHAPAAIVVDRHPQYRSSKLGARLARESGLPLIEVQHHHAHVAACLAENGRALDAAPVLGIVLDGLGLGEEGALWGGEFLLADYRGYRRVGALAPVAMPGGDQAAREPWRNLYAHIQASMGWGEFTARHGDLDLATALAAKPLATLDAMIAEGINAPPASSCGRLFDAVAAALGVCRDRQAYEGDAAARLEALAAAEPGAGAEPGGGEGGYPLAIEPSPDMLTLNARPLWPALFDDLAKGAPASLVAARFHRSLARAVVAMADRLARFAGARRFDTIALSGGCFQNRLLFEAVARDLGAAGFDILTHARLPANDGGLSLGQGAIAAARLFDSANPSNEEGASCALAFPVAS
ncbi:MAG: carbamoyltransferase HypF [Caulobacteraceae bacterium]